MKGQGALRSSAPAAGPAAGKLILRAHHAFTAKEEAFAIVSFSDTGPGIAEEKLVCLFRPFFTTKLEGEGNGLGLYLIKNLVTRNSGKITAASFPDFGTTFTLEFPLKLKTEKEFSTSPS